LLLRCAVTAGFDLNETLAVHCAIGFQLCQSTYFSGYEVIHGPEPRARRYFVPLPRGCQKKRPLLVKRPSCPFREEAR
jgi:hypothetical protein